MSVMRETECSFSLIARILIEQGWKNPVSEKTMINFFRILLFRILFDATNWQKQKKY